jgi:hypothetical protein
MEVNCELIGGPGCGMSFTLPADDSEFKAPRRDTFHVGLDAKNKVIDLDTPILTAAPQVVYIATYERSLMRKGRWLFEFKHVAPLAR